MRFGSVPVVNATGGLKDTVQPYNPEDETGRGFTFQSYNADDFLAAIDRGLALYYDAPEKWARLAQSDMAVDSSWTVPGRPSTWSSTINSWKDNQSL
jgi:starch synthase